MATAKYRNREVKLTADKQAVFRYLVKLRDSGVTNMWGAAPYLEGAFDISEDEAGYWLTTWIKSFNG